MHKFSIYRCLNCASSDGYTLDIVEVGSKIIVLCFKCSNKAKNKPKVNFYPESDDKKLEDEPQKQEFQEEDYVESHQPYYNDTDDYDY